MRGMKKRTCTTPTTSSASLQQQTVAIEFGDGVTTTKDLSQRRLTVLSCPKKIDETEDDDVIIYQQSPPVSAAYSLQSVGSSSSSTESMTSPCSNNSNCNTLMDDHSTHSIISLKPSTIGSKHKEISQKKAMQLLIGAFGIYGAYLYYGIVTEDLYRYRDENNVGFSFVWSLQALESALTIIIGYIGRSKNSNTKNMPKIPFLKSGASQLAAKALMSLSLAAGLSFPVVVLAKSAKIVPVMIGQLLLGGSKYTSRDYLFAILIVLGTSLLSAGKNHDNGSHQKDTALGVVLILASLFADGFTGGLQKKLKKETASYKPNAFDFLLYSHCSQWALAILICIMSGELYTASTYILSNGPIIWWYIIASCICSAAGQCFIFYIIACFDPLVCTTITTTRKMLSIIISISFKGHDLNTYGGLGLLLAITALFIEIEGKVNNFRRNNNKGNNNNNNNNNKFNNTTTLPTHCVQTTTTNPTQ